MTGFQELIVSLTDGFSHFCDVYLARVVICIIVLALFYVIKCILTRLAASVIRKILRRAKDSSKKREQALQSAIMPTLKLSVVTLSIALCLPILSPPRELYDIIVRVIQSLLLISLFSLGYGSARYSRYVLEKKAEENAHFNKLTVDFTVGLLKVVTVLFGTLSVLGQWVDNLSSLLAGVSIGGAAIALASQDTASNFFGALTVMFDHPFDAGDYIEIDGVAGTVEVMGLRSTRIRRSDRSVVVVPNSKMATENIVNWSRTDSRKVEMTLCLKHSTPPEQLEELCEKIKDILKNEDGVLQGDELVLFSDYGESSLNVFVKYYTKAEGYGGMLETKSNVNMKILLLMRSLEVELAYPSRSVYMERADKEEK